MKWLPRSLAVRATLLLGLIALLGYLAIAAGVHTANTSSAVPLLLTAVFPSWFAGFCLAAIAVGALVPAAIMSIATANLFTRNLYGELLHRSFFSATMTGGQEAAMAKVISLAIKLGALAFVLLATLRGTPEIYSGDEIAMEGKEDPDNRRDFPGGFKAGDHNAAFPETDWPIGRRRQLAVKHLLEML